MEIEKLKARIQKRLVKNGRKGCWIWTGATIWNHKDSTKKYGYTTVNGVKVLVRRLIFDLYKDGTLGKRMVKSTCGNSLCCNPHHLYQVGGD